MSVRRAFINIFSDSLAETRDFYTSLFGWRVEYDSDWFVHLQAPDNDSVELGIVRRDHEIVPLGAGSTPRGVLLTIVVDDVDALYERCKAHSVSIVEPPRNMFYGQRRMIIQDPVGTLVDASSACDPDPAFLEKVHERD
ncbi:MAG: VOC family protein [Myxococcota bacterium]